MIISKTPLRISFCGGGSDIPSFYRKHGGCVLSTSIDKYIYITSSRSFERGLTKLRYSSMECVHELSDIKHPVFREMLTRFGMPGYEFTSTSDIPAGTGLGSSSTFTVGLSNVLRTRNGETASKETLAQDACRFEIDILREPIGKQDQYAAAYGGLNFIEFHDDDTVSVQPLSIDPERRDALGRRLMMLYLGGTRSASDILRKQSNNITNGKAETNQKKMCEIARQLKVDLEDGNLDSMGEALDRSWKLKRTLSEGISNPAIDGIYERAIDLGAVGGKLLGAGGNGFMLFYAPEGVQPTIRAGFPDMMWMPFEFDTNGSRIVYNDEV